MKKLHFPTTTKTVVSKSSLLEVFIEMGLNVAVLTERLMELISIVIVSGIISIKLSSKLRLPDTVLFIIAGVIIGPDLLALVSFKDFPMANQFVMTFGAAYILYDGGREIELKVLNKVKVSVSA